MELIDIWRGKRLDLSLVPWRPVLERAKGQSVVGGEGISWSIGNGRGPGR